MSSEQLTFVLIALIVAGIALTLLVVVALLARRRDADRSGQAERLFAAAKAAPIMRPAGAPSATPAASVHAEGADRVTGALGAERVIGTPGAERVIGTPGAERPAGMPFETRDAAPATRDLRAADAANETGRRFSVGDRHNEPGAEAAIAGFLALEPGRIPNEGPTPDPTIDPLTGLDTLFAWERTLAEENFRYVRYRRPVSVVVAEIDGLSRLVDRFGAEPARRVLPAVGDAMRRLARRTDKVAHVGGGRFLVLLPETDEVAAINYVERVRVACERWLESGAVALHLSIGWASPTAVGELDTAMRAAEERMYAERRRMSRQGSGGADAAI